MSNYTSIEVLSKGVSVLFALRLFRFYWLVNLNSTVVFLGIAYIQQSVAKNLGFLIPFTSVLLALIAIHMMRNNLTYKPKKGNILCIKCHY